MLNYFLFGNERNGIDNLMQVLERHVGGGATSKQRFKNWARMHPSTDRFLDLLLNLAVGTSFPNLLIGSRVCFTGGGARGDCRHRCRHPFNLSRAPLLACSCSHGGYIEKRSSQHPYAKLS
jgi:hypothetical protein